MDDNSIALIIVAVILVNSCQGIGRRCGNSVVVTAASSKPSLVDASNTQEDFRMGKPLDLFCCFEGKVAAHISWFKDGKLITDNTKYQYRENRQVLTLPKTSISDNGVYRCHGSNKHGSQSWTINVKIHVPMCKKTPSIRCLSPKVKVKAGDAVSLKCISTPMSRCEPAFPRYVWYRVYHWSAKPGQLTLRKNKANQSTLMTLSIPKATKQHAGYYICKVKDARGEQSCKITLHVL